MKLLRNLQVPTGNILVVQGEYGKLECLSLADYGKSVNVKADFLGIDREIKQVKHTRLLPLEDKWVITTSSQYGCPIKCQFCDTARMGFGGNATKRDIINQVLTAIQLHPEVKFCNRLNHHHARMGEPTLNGAVLGATESLIKIIPEYFDFNDSIVYHPVISTMMPKQQGALGDYLDLWCSYIKNELLDGEAGLQLSINSTDEEERKIMFNNNARTLEDIGSIVSKLPLPKGRKYTLNFAIAGYEIDGDLLASYFDPKYWICKITPMHKTVEALRNNIRTEGDYTTMYPYKKDEETLKDAGFDVLVFVASEEEDLGRITCGNAILSGTLPEVHYNELMV